MAMRSMAIGAAARVTMLLVLASAVMAPVDAANVSWTSYGANVSKTATSVGAKCADGSTAREPSTDADASHRS